MKSFEKWQTQEVETTFGILESYDFKVLNDWLAMQTDDVVEVEKPKIEHLRKEILHNADFWNEDELKMQFIALLLGIVDYTDSSKYYKPFILDINKKHS